MTKEEFACLWIETQKSYGKTEAQIKEKLSSLTGFSVTNYTLSFAANYGSVIKDLPSFLALANDFRRSGNILGKYDIVIRNGREYIVFKGNPRLRNIITKAKYLTSNTQVVKIGVGKQGLRGGAVGGLYITVFFSITLDTINWVFKDNYRWTNWLATIATDVIKAVIGAVAGIIVGTFISAGALAVVSIGFGLLVGVAVGKVLNIIDERLHITDSLIEYLEYMERKARDISDEIYRVYIVTSKMVKKAINIKREIYSFFGGEVRL